MGGRKPRFSALWTSGKDFFCHCCSTGFRRSSSFARKAADGIGKAVADVLADDEVAARDGALQKVDPRVKLTLLAILAVTASLIHSPALLAILYGIGLVLARLSRVEVASLARKVWFSAGFFAAVIALPATTSSITPGPIFVALGPIAISEPGILGATTLVLRVVASANFALLIALTTRWPDILRGLSALKVPEVFVTTLGMSQRYAISLLRTVHQLHLAKESRTIGRFPASEERRWVAGRMAFVVKKSVKMSDEVYNAMLSRGYSGSIHALSPLKAGARDLAWLLSAVLLSMALILINYRVVI
ncbi:MAG: cobalt ECF transporter T component CbiQ [Actinobacteria bacterium]|nr:cobalt ECF transporter T component CbiQ [Actinomycetota bacterium]